MRIEPQCGLRKDSCRRSISSTRSRIPTRPLPDPGGDDGTKAKKDDDSEGLIVKRLTATNTRMSIIPREEGKNPKVWDIIELDMKNLRSGEPSTFTASPSWLAPWRATVSP